MARKEVLQIRCSQLEKDRWRDSAAQQQLELSTWIRLILNQASNQSTSAPVH
jgi:antitoxin component of RelBE/YafQ-DinJ toxin-antitoxin module